MSPLMIVSIVFSQEIVMQYFCSVNKQEKESPQVPQYLYECNYRAIMVQ